MFYQVNFHKTKYKGVFKQYFRDLPEPLLTYDLYSEFLTLETLKNNEEKINFLKEIISFLPKVQKILLFYLLNLLKKISLNKSVNLMNEDNLAVVFAPNILKQKDDVNINDIKKCNNVVSIMIDLFPNYLLDDLNFISLNLF
jgi:hypothetical protein